VAVGATVVSTVGMSSSTDPSPFGQLGPGPLAHGAPCPGCPPNGILLLGRAQIGGLPLFIN
jgi:hypothetical protein